MGYAEKLQLKDAIWQYMIDHSQIQPNGYYGILIYCKERKDFFERIEARREGYKRYNEIDKEIIILRKKKIYEQWLYEKNRNSKMSKRANEIRTGKNIFKKVALWLNRKIKRYLFEGIY